MVFPSSRGSVAMVTLGCTRNEVDSEELAGRLAAEGWTLVDDAADADVAVVNTCGFVEQAKKDSVDTLLAAADLKATSGTQAVVAVGCLAERYGEQLAEALPEADAVLGFDDYADISERLQGILAGEAHVPHVPRDRRRLLPIAPADRPVPSRPTRSRSLEWASSQHRWSARPAPCRKSAAQQLEPSSSRPRGESMAAMRIRPRGCARDRFRHP